MEHEFAGRELREQLIIAGMAELQAHGVADFSLRRVAAACGASCAAPYKHFENKEGLIRAILDFINRRWELLEEQIVSIYKDDPKRLLTELCMANIRFRLANPDFRAALTLGERAPAEGADRMTRPLDEWMNALCDDRERAVVTAFRLRSLIYGGVLMLQNGELPDSPETLLMMRRAIEDTVYSV